MINIYIKEICSVLQIEVPIISYDTSHFATKTTLACCDAIGSTIYIKKQAPNPDLFFAIAHELRHVWQSRTNYDQFLSNYKTSNQIGIEEYNNQLAEIDANAFSSLIMEKYFGLSPLYNGLPEKTIDLIKERMKYLIID